MSEPKAAEAQMAKAKRSSAKTQRTSLPVRDGDAPDELSQSNPQVVAIDPISLHQQMPPARRLSLLICSIGNPGPTYANTLHSAGHTVLNSLAQRYQGPNFQKDRSFGNGLVSKAEEWSLWQSTSYMNESGKGVRSAWQAWSRNISEGEARLVIIYDELEKPLGNVSVRTNSTASARGHNGLKSIMAVMGNTPFARIGIGVGRPASRESDDVARYVLKKMSSQEKHAIESSVEDVIKALTALERG